MLIMINGAEPGTWEAETINEICIFISGRALTIQGCIEIRIIDVKFIGANSNNGTCSGFSYETYASDNFANSLTIFLMKFLDLERILTLLNHIVIDLIQNRCGCKFRSGELGKWTEEEAVCNHCSSVQANDN